MLHLGANIICGDQDQEVTVKRISENVTLQVLHLYSRHAVISIAARRD